MYLSIYFYFLAKCSPIIQWIPDKLSEDSNIVLTKDREDEG